MKYKTLRSIFRFIINIIADVEIEGIEKLPQGNFMIAVNHLGRMDPAMALYAFDREDLIFAVAEKYKNHPLFGAIGRTVNVIWLNRFEADFAALREILARMKKGGVMFIAPEGTRSKTEALQEGKLGAAFLASKSGYPILPVALIGTEDRVIVENLKRFRKSKIKLVAGNMFHIESHTGKGREEVLKNATEEIMCQVAAMLPEKNRGVYADHPRVQELLEQTEKV
jgi:1-acyl-sn-glycerol-3-phosphate acyltransferase